MKIKKMTCIVVWNSDHKQLLVNKRNMKINKRHIRWKINLLTNKKIWISFQQTRKSKHPYKQANLRNKSFLAYTSWYKSSSSQSRKHSPHRKYKNKILWNHLEMRLHLYILYTKKKGKQRNYIHHIKNDIIKLKSRREESLRW